MSFRNALYNGERGNKLSLSLTQTDATIEVKVFFDGAIVDKQTVSSLDELKPNGFVEWITTATIPESGKVDSQNFVGGENSYDESGATPDYSAFISKIGSYSFNAIGVVSEDNAVNKQFADFCIDRRDEMGIKCQAVVYNLPANHEGVVNVKNGLLDLMYWVTGIIAGCEVNASNLNRLYKGEYLDKIDAGEINVDLSKADLEASIKNGEFTLHRVGEEIRVLADINSLTETTAEKGADFKENQTIRVLDQIGNDIAVLFSEKYLGVIPNDNAGRVSLWNDIVKHHQQLLQLRAIEDFLPEHIEVAQGDTKKAVVVIDKVTPVNAMAQPYMTVYVH